MGIVRRGPPADLVLSLKEEFKIDTFVETGTYYGETAVWAASSFSRVITIESSDILFTKAIERFQSYPGIECLHGDSRKLLREVISRLDSPAIFWLDSHWSGGETSGKSDECPLLEEVKVLMDSNTPHLLLIDDARLFLSPPPEPHDPEQWPHISDVIKVLNAFRYPKYIVIIEDVIIDVPLLYKAVVAGYCRSVNTRLWNERKQSSPAGFFDRLCQSIGLK